MTQDSEREECIKIYGHEAGNRIADHWEKIRQQIKNNPTVINVQPPKICEYSYNAGFEAAKASAGAVGLLEKCRAVLKEYINVCYSINDPNDFSPKIGDGGHPARAMLALLESHGIGETK